MSINAALVNIHQKTLLVVRWLAMPWCLLMLTVAFMLTTEFIQADLSWDDGSEFSPMLALAILSIGGLTLMYCTVFGLFIVAWPLRFIFTNHRRL